VKSLGSRYWRPIVQINGELQSEAIGKYGPDIFSSYAEKFVERHRDRPFFLYYPMTLTHDPFVPTPRSKGFSKEQEQRSDRAWFGDMVAYMDEIAGRIVTAIDRAGIGGDTIVLFTGDNGTHPSVTTRTHEGPYPGAKGQTTQGGTHVPLIARWRGRSRPGAVCGDLIDFTDFFPTLAQLAGAKMPAGHPKDGRSFLPQIAGERGNPRDWIFCHYDPRWGKFSPARWVMDKRWKLYGNGRFYDLEKDPWERHPVSDLTAEMTRTRANFEAVLSRMRPAPAKTGLAELPEGPVLYANHSPRLAG
jgi:arylsulfatase A